jgi:LicD family
MSNPSTDQIAACIAELHDALEEAGLWHSLIYGTLLGAVRDGDVIPWDYDFDFLIKPGDAQRIIALPKLRKLGYRLEVRRNPGSWLSLNARGVKDFDCGSLSVFHGGVKVGDLYCFNLFADGVLRRFDLDQDVYWCPHSAFPAFFLEELTTARVRGNSYPVPREPEKLLAGIYGEDWRVPYKAHAQGGTVREGTTTHGDRFEPKLHAEIAWCREQGWDPSRYRNELAWPRPVAGAGPRGPTPRTIKNTGSLWWRDVGELVEYF